MTLGKKYFNKPIRWKTIERIMKVYSVDSKAAGRILYGGKNPMQLFSGKYK